VTREGAKRFLLAYFVIFFGAVLLRIDYFPLSWVPMYGHHRGDADRTVALGDKDARKQGFAAQRANGERLYISAADLGVPSSNFRRLYNRRAFNRGPPQDGRERLELAAVNRWWYETLVGPDPRLTTNYVAPLLKSINRTFGYGPADPRRITRLDISVRTATFSRARLAHGDLSHPRIGRRTAVITEQVAVINDNGKILVLGAAGTPNMEEDGDDGA
jgi:hypothetical protein